MFGDDGGSLFFVGFDGVGDSRVVVDDGDGDAAFDEFGEVVVVLEAEGWPHDEAIDAAVEESVDLAKAVAFFFFEVRHAAEVADPDGDGEVVVVGEGVVDAGEDADPEGVVRRNHDADGLGAAGLHAVDEQVTAPAELLGGFEDAAAGFFAEAFAVAAEDARGGGEGNVGRFRDVFQSRDMRSGHRLDELGGDLFTTKGTKEDKDVEGSDNYI